MCIRRVFYPANDKKVLYMCTCVLGVRKCDTVSVQMDGDDDMARKA